MTYKEYLARYDKEDRQHFVDYLAAQELKEWQQLYADDDSLTKDNIKKFFNKCWQVWNTYSDDKCADLVDKNGAGCEDVHFEDVDWDLLIKQVNEDEDFDYNLHQYADYACIFLYFSKGHLYIDSPFLNDNAEDHLAEDFENKRYTRQFIENAMEAEIE